MSVRITYFVHGTSVDNENGLSSGWKDAPLSALGVRQAKELKRILDSRLPACAKALAGRRGNDKTAKFDAVFSSDLERAANTAKIAFGNSIVLDARLRECNYGSLNGKATAIVEPMQERTSQRFPEGESYEDVKKRTSDFLEFLKREHDGKHVALISHKAPQLALMVLLAGKTWAEAFAEDWRKTGSWQSGWKYTLN